MDSYFANFEYLEKYDTYYEPKGHFFVKILGNCKKNALLAKKYVICLQKLKISKIWIHQFVAGPIKSLYTKNQLIPTIRLWLLLFSGEKVVPRSQGKNRKKMLFFGTKSANFQNVSKIFWNLMKHIEIHIWSKFQLIWTFFWHFMAILNPNFVVFYI